MVAGPESDMPERRLRRDEKLPNPKDSVRAKRQNELLDEGLRETFPASDPVSVVRLK